MPDESRVVRPPEFKKVLEELHAVRLGKNLKSEIQGRRDLEDIYHRLLEELAALEETVAASRSELASVQAQAGYAVANEAAARFESRSLQKRLVRMRTASGLLALLMIVMAVVAWEDLRALYQGALASWLD